jgi:hypothetical protein
MRIELAGYQSGGYQLVFLKKKDHVRQSQLGRQVRCFL